MIVENLIIFNDMLQSLLFVVFVNGILTARKSRLLTSIVFISAMSLAYLLTIPIRANFKPVIMISLFAVLIYFLYKDTMKKKIIIAAILFVFIAISEGMGVLLFLFLSNSNFQSIIGFSIQRLIASVLFNLVFVSISMIANLNFNKFKGRIKTYMVAILTGLPICYITMVVVLFYKNINDIDENMLIYATFGMAISIFTDIVIFNLIKTQREISNKEKTSALMEVHHDLEFKYYELALAESQNIFKFKHDFINYLQTINSLFLSNDAKQKEIGMEMAEKLKAKLSDISDIEYCENKIVNIVLTLKTKEARSLGIDTNISVSVPESIGIDKIDLCSIFSNLYDNAIEACKKVESPRKIEINTGTKLNYLIIKFINTSDFTVREKDGELLTTKDDAKNHGLGIKIINEIAEKYNGSFEYENHDNLFIAKAILRQK